MAEIKKIDDIKYDFKDLTPFKWYVLENFPFIEADFDALTNWQLLCKLGKELNKVIDSQNSVGAQVEILTTAFNNLNHAFGEFTDDMLDKFATFKNETNTTITNFKNETNENMNNFTTRITNQITDFENTSNTNYGQFTSQITKSFQELQDYIENYFKNLNIQDEVNTKLDEMVQDGSFQKLVEEAIKQSDIENIIKSYLTNVVYGYDTLANLKAVTSIEAGNIVRTLGNQTMTDGKGSYYKIRTKTSSDVIDEDKIVSLTNFSSLVAEKIEETGTAVETNDNPLDVPTICIGDDYAIGTDVAGTPESWVDQYQQYSGIKAENLTKLAKTGAGFYGDGTEANRFETLLSQFTGDKTKIKKIIVLGGLNDINADVSDIIFRLDTFMASCKTLFPNAKVFIGMCTNINAITIDGNEKLKLINNVLYAYKKECQSSNALSANTYYINGIETVLKADGGSTKMITFSPRGSAIANMPNHLGVQAIAKGIIDYFTIGSCYLSSIIIPITSDEYGINIVSNNGNTYISKINTTELQNYKLGNSVICTITDNDIVGTLTPSSSPKNMYAGAFPITLSFTDSNDNFHMVSTYAYFNYYSYSPWTMYIYLVYPTPLTNYTVKDGTKVSLQPFSAVIPTVYI